MKNKQSRKANFRRNIKVKKETNKHNLATEHKRRKSIASMDISTKQAGKK